MNVHFSSKTDSWSTPQDFFDELNKEFKFGFDVCADVDNTKCGIDYYDKSEDALTQDWSHTYSKWMNPPYGREIGKWVKKASENPMTVCLLPARTDTKWFHDYILGKAEIRFIKGRLKFGEVKIVLHFRVW